MVQGEPGVLSLGLGGTGDLAEVTGEGLVAWAVRRSGDRRFLDLEVDPAHRGREFHFVARGSRPGLELPAELDLPHLRPGMAVGP